MGPIQLFQNAIVSINRRFTTKLAEDPAALAVLFRSLRDAESDGESVIFDMALPRVPRKLEHLVRTHANDEERHEAMMSEVLEMLGCDADSDGDHVSAVPYIDEAAGTILTAAAESDVDLGRAYLLVYALERRLSAQLSQLAAGIEHARPEIAAMVREVAADEMKHIGWCGVVSHHLIGDTARWEAERDAMIELESRTYPRLMAQNLNAMLDEGLTNMSTVERAFWRCAAWVADRLPAQPVPDPSGVIAARDWVPRELGKAA